MAWPPYLATLFFVLLHLVSADGNSNNNNNSNLTVCEAECWKCSQGPVSRARCLTLCPSAGTDPCNPPKKLNELVIGATVGIVLCLTIAMAGFLCIRFKRRRKDNFPKQSAKALKNFHKDLDRLRPHAYTFLSILNNVRRQVRDMHRAGNTDAAIICGRSLSDLAKILMLLNRTDIPIVPPDWPRLVSWAERLLERTSLAVVQPPQPQMAQLIQFLQTPPAKVHGSLNNTNSTMMSTLKPPTYEAALSHKDSVAYREFDTKAEWHERWQFQDGSVPSKPQSQSTTWSSRQSATQNNIWFDDDFLLMNFRPQDEIVTVL